MTAVLFVLIPINSLIAGTKEDLDKATKDLIEAQSLNIIASKAWNDYKNKTKFPPVGAEEKKKSSAAYKKLLEAKKNHPALLKVNKEHKVAVKEYQATAAAARSAKAKIPLKSRTASIPNFIK